MSIFYSADLNRDIDRYLDEQESFLADRPVCWDCEEHIQGDHLWEFDDDLYCEDCVDLCSDWADNYVDPICEDCGHRITEDSTVWRIANKLYCSSCLDKHRRLTDEFIM